MADDWKYAVEDFEDDESGGDGPPMDANGSDADGRATDVFGERSSGTIEPGSPSLENALFVVLGVAVALVVLAGI